MKFSADFSLKCTCIGRNFYHIFLVIFKKLQGSAVIRVTMLAQQKKYKEISYISNKMYVVGTH